MFRPSIRHRQAGSPEKGGLAVKGHRNTAGQALNKGPLISSPTVASCATVQTQNEGTTRQECKENGKGSQEKQACSTGMIWRMRARVRFKDYCELTPSSAKLCCRTPRTDACGPEPRVQSASTVL